MKRPNLEALEAELASAHRRGVYFDFHTANRYCDQMVEVVAYARELEALLQDVLDLNDALGEPYALPKAISRRIALALQETEDAPLPT